MGDWIIMMIMAPDVFNMNALVTLSGLASKRAAQVWIFEGLISASGMPPGQPTKGRKLIFKLADVFICRVMVALQQAGVRKRILKEVSSVLYDTGRVTDSTPILIIMGNTVRMETRQNAKMMSDRGVPILTVDVPQAAHSFIQSVREQLAEQTVASMGVN